MTLKLFAAALLLISGPSFLRADDAGFRALFNGTDLDGWVRVNTAPSTWTVRDGMLICSGKPIGELRTTRMYQNFIMEVEWRHMKPRGNAGIFVWADDITARGVPFHRSIEVQVLENAYGNTRSYTTHGDIFPIHGATMTPINGRGGSRAFPTEKRSNPSPQWNHYRIECRDGDISLAVNGKVVTRGKACSPRKGYICLESEGGVVHYRNLKVKELPDTPVDPEHVAIENRGYRSIYSGIDLSGWSTADSANWKTNDWVLSYVGAAGDSTSSLSTKTEFGDFGFVVDFRLKKQSGEATLQLRSSHSDAIALNQAGEFDAAQFNPLGWNRLEGTVIGRHLKVSLNGVPVIDREYRAAAHSRQITLLPRGPIDFANIYVREISK